MNVKTRTRPYGSVTNLRNPIYRRLWYDDQTVEKFSTCRNG